MGIFNFSKKNKIELSDEQKKWNKMWQLWTEGKVDSPFAELMTYQSEINNGGHSQYFFNIGNTGDLEKEMLALSSILSEHLKSNFQNAYEAYLALEENVADKKAEQTLEKCDAIFYENEEEINQKLEEYSLRMEP